MSSSSESEDVVFVRGRINSKDLARHPLKFVQDYAARYDVPQHLPKNKLVSKIFEGRARLIPVLPNHTWTVDQGHIILTDRRDPPAHPHHLAPARADTQTKSRPFSNAFPEVPEDTFSRSPSPVIPAELPPPQRLPLVFPPVGALDAGGTQPLPEDWMQQVLEEYDEDHVVVAGDVESLNQKMNEVSADIVRIMSKINQEREHTQRLIQSVEDVCGKEFIDQIMRDVHATTNFEMNQKLRATGLLFPSTLRPGIEGSGGRIRSKVPSKDKQIFSVEGGSGIPLHQLDDLRLPLKSQDAVPSDTSFNAPGPSVEPRKKKTANESTTAEKIPAPSTSGSNNTVAPLTGAPINDTGLISNSSHLAESSAQGAKGNKRTWSAQIPDNPFAEPASPLKRRRASPSPEPGPNYIWLPKPAPVPSTSLPVDPPPPMPQRDSLFGTPSLDGDSPWTFPTQPIASSSSSQPLQAPRETLFGIDSLFGEPLGSNTMSSFSTSGATGSLTTNSGQTTSSSSLLASNFGQPAADTRRPKPLQRDYQRVFINEDGTIEARDYRTPEYLERHAQLERDIAKHKLEYALDCLVETFESRYPVLFVDDEGSEHIVRLPSTRKIL